MAKQSSNPILSGATTGAFLHGRVFWLGCHLEGCLRQPQGHWLQFTWKKQQKNNEPAPMQSCSLSLTFSCIHRHMHTPLRPSVTFVSDGLYMQCCWETFYSPVFSLLTRTHTQTHTMEAEWDSEVRTAIHGECRVSNKRELLVDF